MMRTIEYDILILGGGASGVAGAIQAARLGVSVLVVEESAWVGGMLTAAGVSAIDGNHRLPSGIWGEFRKRLREYYGGAEHLATGWVSHTQFEPRIGCQILTEMLREYSNITILYGYHFESLSFSNRSITDIIISNGSETLKVISNIYIDASEYGDLIEKYHCRFYTGRNSLKITGETNAPETTDGFIQDLTWVAVLKDFGPGTDRRIPKPDNYKPELYHGCHENLGSGVEAVQKMLDYGRLPNNKFMLNWPHKGNDYYLNYLGMDREKRNHEFRKARERTLGFVYYIQNELNFPHIGLDTEEFPDTEGLALIPYIRESRRIVGQILLTQNDLLFPWTEKYQQGIAVGDYPLDHHHKQAGQDIIEEFPEVSAFSVPFGSLLPEDVDNLIAAEKNISVSHLANGCTRLQPVVMGIGQAAGAAAAMSIKQNKLPKQLAVRDVQDILLAHNCYIVPVHDVTLDDNGFDSVQRIMASGIMMGESVHANWENRIHFNPHKPATWKLLKDTFSKASLRANQIELHPYDFVKNADLFDIMDRQDIVHLQAIIPNNSEPLTRLKLAILIDMFADPFHKKDMNKAITIMEQK